MHVLDYAFGSNVMSFEERQNESIHPKHLIHINGPTMGVFSFARS